MAKKKKNRPPVSQAQARLFGLEAGGVDVLKGLSQKQARDKLRGVKISKLPERIKKKGK